jgi:GT2 family glycosyltransferase
MPSNEPTILISTCCAVYRAHDAPNLGTLAESLEQAAAPYRSELCVALNGIAAEAVGAPASTRTADLGVNRGVAPGWNAAATLAAGEILVFANDDALPQPSSLARLADALLADPLAGVVGPAGARWDTRTGEAGADIDASALLLGERVEVEAVSGFLFACRRAVFEAVGGFDEQFAPASWEEIDFCTAMRAQGLRNYVVGAVAVEHEYGISRPQPPWRRIRFDGRSESIWSVHRRNRRHFLSKWSDRTLPPVAT